MGRRGWMAGGRGVGRGRGERGAGFPSGERLSSPLPHNSKRHLFAGLHRRGRIGVEAPPFLRLAFARRLEVDANDLAKGRAVFPIVAVKVGVDAGADVHKDAGRALEVDAAPGSAAVETLAPGIAEARGLLRHDERAALRDFAGDVQDVKLKLGAAIARRVAERLTRPNGGFAIATS